MNFGRYSACCRRPVEQHLRVLQVAGATIVAFMQVRIGCWHAESRLSRGSEAMRDLGARHQVRGHGRWWRDHFLVDGSAEHCEPVVR